MRSPAIALVASLMAALSFAPAFAAEPKEPPITNPDQLIDSVTAENVAGLITELGGQNIETKDIGDGQKLISFTDGNIRYNLGVALCNVRPGKCVALALAIVVATGTTNYPLEVLNKYNKDTLFATLIKIDETKIGVGHMMLVDGGITKKNLAINIGSFALTFQDAMKYLASQLVAGYQGQAGAFRQAGYYAPSMPQTVFATPQEMSRIMAGMQKSYRTTLRPR